jgi:succinate dehydrogenase/fumarate reductase flavoprotein subunit
LFVDSDILVVGGGMSGCGATYESRYWGRDLKIICVEKANIERSGAVARGLYAINCYMGMQWNENRPEDHVRYARNDLMGLVREDLGYDIARHVDSTVHKFEEWGLPIMRDPKTGSSKGAERPCRRPTYPPLQKKMRTGNRRPGHSDNRFAVRAGRVVFNSSTDMRRPRSARRSMVRLLIFH